MYEDMRTALLGCTEIQMAEYEWSTRPTGDHGVFKPDFDVQNDAGDDFHQDTIREGSIDLYTHGKNAEAWAEVEGILDTYCEASWYLNYEGIDQETRLLRREYIFQIID